MAEGTWSEDVKKLEALIRDSVRESEQRQEKLWRESEEKFEKLFFEMKGLIMGLSVQPVESMNKLPVEISSTDPITQRQTFHGEAISGGARSEAEEKNIPNSQACAGVAEGENHIDEEIFTIVSDGESFAIINKGLKFPVIAKTLVADGSATSHKMSLVFNGDGLKGLTMPIVLQELANHGRIVFKVYDAEEFVKAVKQRSLLDISRV